MTETVQNLTIASNEKLLTLIKILLTEVKKEEEAEKDLYLTDGVVLNTIKSVGEEDINFFQQELDSLDIPEGVKVALKTLAKFVTVLTSKKFGKAEKIKICSKLEPN